MREQVVGTEKSVCDVPTRATKGAEANRNDLPPHMRSNKEILNAAAARLGQAYRETSDKLQRDNLEATASVVNCVGGSNGRMLPL